MYGGLDERSDIYSLGGVLFAILTLRPPVRDTSVRAVLEKVRKGALETMTLPAGSVGLGSTATMERKVPEALRALMGIITKARTEEAAAAQPAEAWHP
jgi:serine/threonine protein kinase